MRTLSLLCARAKEIFESLPESGRKKESQGTPKSPQSAQCDQSGGGVDCGGAQAAIPSEGLDTNFTNLHQLIMNPIENLQAMLDKRADARLRQEINSILQPLQRHIETVPGYPSLTIDGKEHQINNAFMSNIREALFEHSSQHNRVDESNKFLSETESFRQQLEELQNAQASE